MVRFGIGATEEDRTVVEEMCDELRFVVITGVPSPPHDGNLWDGMLMTDGKRVFVDAGDDFCKLALRVILQEPDGHDGWNTLFDSQTDKTPFPHVQLPVFTVGELVVVDANGREVNGHGRKPRRWFVDFEVYDDFETAIARAVQVSDADLAGQEAPPPLVPPVNCQTAAMRKAEVDRLCAAIEQMLSEQLERLPIVVSLKSALKKIAEEVDHP